MMNHLIILGCSCACHSESPMQLKRIRSDRLSPEKILERERVLRSLEYDYEFQKDFEGITCDTAP